MNRIFVLVLLCFSISTFAQEEEDREPAAAGVPACNALKDACLKAGYVMTGPKSSEKSIVGGCMAKIVRGESVKNLKVKATDPAIEPCINFMKAKMYDMSQKPKPAAKQTAPAAGFKPVTPHSRPTVPPKNTKGSGK